MLINNSIHRNVLIIFVLYIYGETEPFRGIRQLAQEHVTSKDHSWNVIPDQMCLIPQTCARDM